MPPKPKFSKEEIVMSAFDLMRFEGAESLTAREIGKRLGVSSSPIFTFFRDMDELRDAVFNLAREKFESYMSAAESYYPAYKKRGMQFVLFAKEEPQLFKLLFMRSVDKNLSFERVIDLIPFDRDDDISIIKRDYNATAEQVERLFEQMWIYTYGLCVLSAQGVCSFSEEETARRLGEVFAGTVHIISSGGGKMSQFLPVKPQENGYAELLNLKPDFSETE